MKTVSEIAAVALEGDLFASACAEINHRTETGLWPKHIPAMGPFIHDLTITGYPSSDCMNIAIRWVETEAVRRLAKK